MVLSQYPLLFTAEKCCMGCMHHDVLIHSLEENPCHLSGLGLLWIMLP